MRDRFASKSKHMKSTVLCSALLVISFALTAARVVAQNYSGASAAICAQSGSATTTFHNNLPPANDSGAYGAIVFPATLSLYPNPAVNELTIDMGTNMGENKNLYSLAVLINSSGFVLTTIHLNPDQTKIDISRLHTGMYYITLRGESGIKVLKFEKM